MALNSSEVSAGDKAKATQYNNLRTDVTSHNHDGSDTAQIDAIQTGWSELYSAGSKLAWTYASTVSFTVAGDWTAYFTKGTKIRYKQGGAYEYGVIASSSYSDPNTTVTLIANTDYALASAAITDHYFSYAENPQGFPHWFNYTPTYAGFASNPNAIHRFCVNGRVVHVVVGAYGNGASNATTFTITAPVASANVTNHNWRNFADVVDNGTNTWGNTLLDANSSTITLLKNGSSTGFTNSGLKSAAFELFYEF